MKRSRYRVTAIMYEDFDPLAFFSFPKKKKFYFDDLYLAERKWDKLIGQADIVQIHEWKNRAWRILI